MKSISKFWIPWFTGIIIALLAIGLWRNWELDWVIIVTIVLGGLIGGGVAFRGKKARHKV